MAASLSRRREADVIWFSWFGSGITTPAGPRTRSVTHEDRLSAGGDETTEKILRRPLVDLAGCERRPQLPVTPRVVHVDVEPVLVGTCSPGTPRLPPG